MKQRRSKVSAGGQFSFSLQQNVPNPFYHETEICFSIERDSFVKLTVYNLREEPLMVLCEAQMQAGQYAIKWDGKGYDGQRFKHGSYIYCLEADGFFATRRLRIQQAEKS